MNTDHIEYLDDEEDKKAAIEEYIQGGCCSAIGPNDYTAVYDMVGVCKFCGCPVDEYGEALFGCSYSPSVCEHCGYQPCDQSC